MDHCATWLEPTALLLLMRRYGYPMRVIETVLSQYTTAVVTAGTRAAPLPPLLRAAAAARVGSAAASTLILAAAPPQAAPGRALEYPAELALRVKGPARRALEDV